MSGNGNAIIFRVGLDTRSIGQDAQTMEKSVTAGAQRAAATSSRLARQMAKEHQRAAADIEKAYKEAAESLSRTTDATYAKFNKDAELRQRALRSSLRQEGGSPGSGGGHGAGGHGHGMGNSRAVGDILDNITGTTGWGMRANIAAHFAPLIPPLLIAMLAQKGMADQFKLGGENDKLAHLIGQGTAPMGDRFKSRNIQEGGSVGAADAQSVDAMVERRAAIHEQIEKSRSSRTFLASTAGSATNIAMAGNSGTDQVNRSFRVEQQAREKLAEIDATIGQRIHDQIAAREILVHQSQFQGELAQAELDRQEKLAKLRDEFAAGKMGSTEYVGRRKQIDSEAGDRVDAAQLRHTALQEETDQQLRLDYIRVQGDDESVKAAYARVDAAKQEWDLAQTDEQRNSAAAKIDAAETEYYLAQKTRDEQRSSQAAELQLAGLRMNADQAHLAALMSEQRLIEAKQADIRTTPDAKRGLAVDAARNAKAQLQLGAKMGLSTFDIANSALEGTTGKGQAAQQETLKNRIAIERGRLTYLKNNENTKDDAGAIAAQVAKVHELTMQYDEVERLRGKSVRDAQFEIAILDTQIDRMDKVAAAMRTQHEYQEKINEATRNGNTELAANLETQRQLSLKQQVQSLSREIGDRSKGSLAELAGHAFNQDGAKARQAMRLEQRADIERKRGHQQRAAQLQDQADAIKGGIGPLKDADKSGGFLKAQLTQLEMIEKNTAKAGLVRQ